MSKEKYLVFTNNRLPRLLTNPSSGLLSHYNSDQIAKQPKNRLKGVPLEYLILEEGVVREARGMELEEIKKEVGLTRVVQEEDIMYKEIEKKLKEVINMVANQEADLQVCKEALEKAEKGVKWKKVALLSLALNIINAIYLVNLYLPEIKGLLK